ncbi:hypothetical protein GPECTOR_100g7 [Gonium pectorale]|uniref:WSC domain-containing protein n=1 Tax=Gonium pectorale TaxID=33097 RepID=A0A150FZY7_GONPE|nr:hypothetical protein GPECTOR_100g7 [Gonium pectorale]|eukprot:KXZ43154.1 hypothetical protein GPECTOR_100g7 [Gonium pectorale]
MSHGLRLSLWTRPSPIACIADFCSAGACGLASCINAGGTWTCGPCPAYTTATTTTVFGVKGPTCRGYDAGFYLGCFADRTAGDTSPFMTLLATRADMAPTLCAALARVAGHMLYGVQYGSRCYGGSDLKLATSGFIVYGEQGGNQCFAGANLTLAFSLGASSSCDMACIADPTQTCGGTRAISVFLLGDVVDGLPNLALDRPAYASFSSPGSLFGPQCAVDGVTQYFGNAFEGGRSYIFHSAPIPAPWLSVDLGAPAAIVRVVIWNRCDCCSGRLQGADLRIGNGSITSAPADTARLPENPLAWKQNAPLGLCASQVVTFSTPHVGRWVTLQNHNLGFDSLFHITELQVYGLYPGGDTTSVSDAGAVLTSSPPLEAEGSGGTGASATAATTAVGAWGIATEAKGGLSGDSSSGGGGSGGSDNKGVGVVAGSAAGAALVAVVLALGVAAIRRWKRAGMRRTTQVVPLP